MAKISPFKNTPYLVPLRDFALDRNMKFGTEYAKVKLSNALNNFSLMSTFPLNNLSSYLFF